MSRKSRSEEKEKKEEGRARDVVVVVSLDRSAIDGAPQCPSCFARIMKQRDDGTFACPGGCPKRVVLVQVSMNAAEDEVLRVFFRCLGDMFRIEGRA